MNHPDIAVGMSDTFMVSDILMPPLFPQRPDLEQCDHSEHNFWTNAAIQLDMEMGGTLHSVFFCLLLSSGVVVACLQDAGSDTDVEAGRDPSGLSFRNSGYGGVRLHMLRQLHIG